MSFENPALLHLLWALLAQALLLFVYWQWRRHTLKRLGSPALEKRLMLGFSERRFWFKNILFAAAVALVALAIANPQHAVRVQPKAQTGADVLIALDISNSMLVKDVSPSRLEQAKKLIRQLVEALDGERLGLIFFAGDAYPQMPLSTDYDALLLFVRNANPDFITDQGTDMASAVDLAARMFETSEAGHALILITDGENHQEKALQRAREAKADGMIIHTIGIGTTSGGMIPAPGGGTKRDFTGVPIRSILNEPFLREMAQAGGGLNLNGNTTDNAVSALKTEVDRLQKSTVEAQAYTEYESYFQWLLFPALLLLVIEQLLWWRKKKVMNDE